MEDYQRAREYLKRAMSSCNLAALTFVILISALGLLIGDTFIVLHAVSVTTHEKREFIRDLSNLLDRVRQSGGFGTLEPTTVKHLPLFPFED
jgi:hypothetical protein